MSTARRFFRTLLFASITSHACGPVTDEMLIKYPRRQIDRPYTQPKGLKSWEPSLGPVVYEKSENDGNVRFGFTNPLVWTYPVSDNLNFHFVPIPMALSYQILRNETSVLGANAGISFVGYSSFEGWFFTYFSMIRYRRKVSDNIAMGLRSMLVYNYSETKKQRDSVDMSISIGPLLQVLPTVSVTPYVEATHRIYLGPVRAENGSARSSGTGYPIGLVASWSVSRRWDVDPGYRFYGLGYGDYTGHFFSLASTLYWQSKAHAEPSCRDVECAN